MEMSSGDPLSPTTHPPVRSRRAVDHVVDRFLPRRLHPQRERATYLVVGAWNTLFGYGVFVALYATLEPVVGYGVVLVAGYVVTIINAYLGYRYITFRSHGPILPELARFALVYIATLAVNLIAFPIALTLTDLSPYLVQGLFTAVTIVATYFAHKRVTFGIRRNAASGQDR